MSKRTIVCIDDERSVLISLRDQLTRLLGNSYNIELTESGLEALELLAELKEEQIEIPLIICDQIIGDMKGDELLIKIHALYSKTLKILLTGQAHLDAVINAINSANLYRFISKPWDETDLNLTVREALRSYFQEQELVNQNIALRASQQQLTQFLEAMPVAVAVFEPLGIPYYLNEKAEQLLGKDLSVTATTQTIAEAYQLYVTGTTLLYPAEDLPITKALNGESSRVDDIEIHRGKRKISIEVWGTPIRDEQDNIIYGIIAFQDITERKKAEEELIYNACHDTLTGLLNQTALIEALKTAIASAQLYPNYLFAVLLLDLDSFKLVNESLGHEKGDQLLIAVAQRLQAYLTGDATIARFGGDEFIILLGSLKTAEDARKAAKGILKIIASPFNLEGYEIFLTTSIGIVFSNDSIRQPEDFLRDADIAMYRAKAKGKSGYAVFDTDMRTQISQRLHLERDLRLAIERKELQLYYQPIIATVTREGVSPELNSRRGFQGLEINSSHSPSASTASQIVGFEALIRWHHPTQGFIPPDRFIPIAEETNLIVLLGSWILWEACTQMNAWQSQYPNHELCYISVNLSARQLLQSNFVEQVKQTLEKTNLQPQYLNLEVTETSLIANKEVAGGKLQQLRNSGIRLSLDDFGTGFSSLSYLHRFPVNYLKIDRSFVKNITSNFDSLKITESILVLAQNLKMQVIAEGVETEEQMCILKDLGCEYFQGYLFSPPVPKEKATELLLVISH